MLPPFGRRRGRIHAEHSRWRAVLGASHAESPADSAAVGTAGTSAGHVQNNHGTSLIHNIPCYWPTTYNWLKIITAPSNESRNDFDITLTNHTQNIIQW